MATPKNEPAPPSAAEELSRLTEQHLPELVAYCRREILARPRLQRVVEQLRIADSDDWLQQAVTLFRMCPVTYSPAVEWHDEVGGLSFTAGLSVSDANDCLCILRDAMIDMVWRAQRASEVGADDVPPLVRLVLQAFDCSLDAQASAYVRESQRHLSEVNRRLELRQHMFERDLALAKLVQQQFIPKNFDSPSFRAEVRYVPTTSVGGDHAGIFPVSDHVIYVTICDVTGHGIASALAAEVVSSQLRPLLHRQIDHQFQYAVEPLSVVRELNALFYKEFQPLGMLLSFFIALVDSKAGTLTYSGAGHPPPILQYCSEHRSIDLRSQNIILGAREDCVLGDGQNTVPLHRGDRVLFYTDGIMEANDGKGKMLGLKGLRSLVDENYETPSKVLANEVLSTAKRYYGGRWTDDMSLILLDVLKSNSE